MLKVVIAGAFVATIAVSVPTVASTGALRFRDLENAQPRDPLTGSNPAFVEVHHSPADELAPALQAVAHAVPVGTDRQDAARVLHAAGAKCHDTGSATMTCVYRDIETVDEYLDDVTWTVKLDTAGGEIASLSLDRAWQRH